MYFTETCLKQPEADNNLLSVSSGTTSDEIYLVKDKSSSSQEYTEPMCQGGQKFIEPVCERSPKYLEDGSLPSGIPSGFGPGMLPQLQYEAIWGLTLSLLMTTPEAFVDSVDQDQTAQNVQSDL